MPERDGYPAGVPCWVDTRRADPAPAAAFYEGLFGWEFEDLAPEGTPSYLVGRIRGRAVAGLGQATNGAAAGPPAWTTYVRVDDADRAAAAASAAGGAVLVEPVDVGPAGRLAVLTDPTGAPFGVWQAGAHRGAGVVNETGAWVGTDFRTRDPEAATVFYGAVFGWEVDPIDPSAGYANVRMPGYGAHLTELDPTLPDRLREYGAPENFADVVGWMAPIGDGEPAETPSRWGITFAVDDVDASAARVPELGGTVLVPPMDAPWVRMAVVADPDGAPLTIATFVPPS
jgi:predicted enzyme related to lactoylglutathione lyase